MTGPTRSRSMFRLGQLLERRAQLHPDRTALVFGDRAWTYGQLRDWIVASARQLRRHGAGPGSVIAYAGASRPEVFVLMYATSRIGGVFVPVNGAATPPEIAYLLADSGADVLITDAPCAAKLVGGGVPPGVTRLCLDEEPPDGYTPLNRTPDEPVGDDTPAPVTEDDLALIAYTSGTSGRPKGVLLTHGNVFWSCVNGLLGLDLARDDVTLITTPVFHIAVLSGVGSYTWAKGGTVVLEPTFSVDGFLTTVRRHRVSVTFAVPAMLALIARHPGFAAADLSSLRWILSGGAAAPAPVAEVFHRRGIPVLSSYGLTETAAGVTYRDPRDGPGCSGEAGLAAPLAEVRIVGADNRPVPHGTTGEIVVRSPSVAAGYLGLPEDSAAARDADGWFHGGDRGYMDSEGRLVVVGRIKDTIITGGENVDPTEVEEALAACPCVDEAAVVGTPDPVWGEVVTAIVVPAEGADCSLEDIQTFLSASLTRHKIPRRLEIRERLPRTATGKLQRSLLRG
ncbi:AMP-binding protein [Streptomyces sp. NBC_00487]|uniref:class I adenylate-forming enzyme family protein n=1 Tax=unclassified Streptomyces TaxID=2593676 RepID=UPI002E19F0C0|nr:MULTISPECIES: AMP-binding protein [unclassified Streptomyces]